MDPSMIERLKQQSPGIVWPSTEGEADRVAFIIDANPGARTSLIYRALGDKSPLEDDLPAGSTIIYEWDAAPSSVSYADIGVVYLLPAH